MSTLFAQYYVVSGSRGSLSYGDSRHLNKGYALYDAMKVARKGLGQSVGLGLTLVAGCAAFIALMSYAA